jgi:hypothetical protein
MKIVLLTRSTRSLRIGASSLYTRNPVSVRIRITFRRYAGECSIICCSGVVTRPKNLFALAFEGVDADLRGAPRISRVLLRFPE